jgi:hypothetical protein
MRGFKKIIQRNVLVQQRGDVTADLKMETGAVNESITITDSPVAIQFNTASRDLTIESKLVRELPTATRNPFQLALLDRAPGADNRRTLHRPGDGECG